MAEDKDKVKDVGSDEPKDKPEPDGEGDKKTGQYDEAFVKSLQTESILRKKKINDLEKKLKAFEDEKLTEGEKKDKKIADLEKQYIDLQTEQKDKDIDNLILTVANGKNFNDIEVVMMVVKKELENEEEPDKKTIEKIVEKLIKDKPYLVSSGSPANPSSGNFPKTDKETAKDVNQMMGDFLHGK